MLAGLGPLAAGLARLAVEAGQAVTLDAMEVLVVERGRELLRGVVQLSLDAQAEREVRLPQVTGADGVRRGRAERGHARHDGDAGWVRWWCGGSATGPGSRGRGRCSRAMRC